MDVETLLDEIRRRRAEHQRLARETPLDLGVTRLRHETKAAAFAELITWVEEEDAVEDGEVMVMVGGASHRCDCGCNVFRRLKRDATRYRCNGCRATWAATAVAKEE